MEDLCFADQTSPTGLNLCLLEGTSTMRIATWNLKQAVAPKADPDTLWEWTDKNIQADVVVFTEAKVPIGHDEKGWRAIWDPRGLHPGRKNPWGTVIASRTCELVPLTGVGGRVRKTDLTFRWPGAIQIVDVVVSGQRWATVVGLYGVLQDLDGNRAGNAMESLDHFLRQMEPLLQSKRGRRLVIAGDFNIWPFMTAQLLRNFDLTDLIEYSANERKPLQDCANCSYLTKNKQPPREPCGHLWTHRNDGGPNPAKQQIDFILATDELVDEFMSVSGGVADFPDVWSVSDHAPVIADFDA